MVYIQRNVGASVDIYGPFKDTAAAARVLRKAGFKKNKYGTWGKPNNFGRVPNTLSLWADINEFVDINDPVRGLGDK
jgi:hypothetical protein